MVIKYYDGNLLTTSAEVIIHQVNCQGAMNSGVAKGIRDKWPEVFEHYRTYWEIETNHGESGKSELLGKVLPVSIENGARTVMNMFSQEKFGYDGEKYTSYDALDTCLKKIAKYCREYNISSLALPWNMACGRGGANWNVVKTMISEIFKDTEVEIEIWKI